jgi:hypothetical protein
LFLAPQNLFFCLEPVVEFRARFVASFDVEFVGSAPDSFFERRTSRSEVSLRVRVLAWESPLAMTVSQTVSDRKGTGGNWKGKIRDLGCRILREGWDADFGGLVGVVRCWRRRFQA